MHGQQTKQNNKTTRWWLGLCERGPTESNPTPFISYAHIYNGDDYMYININTQQYWFLPYMCLY